MPIANIQDVIDQYIAATAQQKLALKNAIFGEAKLKDVNDLIIAGTIPKREELADLIDESTNLRNTTVNAANAAQRVIDIATAQTWYDDNILPTLTWINTDTNEIQLVNSIADRVTLKALSETDEFRLIVISQSIEVIRQRIRTLKTGI